MRLDLRYGDGERSLILPGDVTLDYLEPSPVVALDDPAVALGRALTAPVGSGPLSAQLDARQKVLIVIADPTRSGTEVMSRAAYISTAFRLEISLPRRSCCC